MQANTLILFSILVAITMQLSIPLTQNMNRCMIVYTSSPDENLILDIKFPSVQKQQPTEYYRITILNTQDKTSIQQKIKYGSFRKELDLEDSVVYKVCFAFITSRPVNNIVIEYNAQTKFNHQIENAKVPQTLLKSEDFKGTYAFADNMFDLTKTAIQFQKERRAKEDAIYQENNKYIDTLFWISIFEMLVICLTGIYQFFTVKNFLITKNYL